MSALARVVLGLALGLAACGGEPEPAAPVAPPSLRATWVLEPPRVRVGDVATLELAVVTPPDHRVLPPRLPEELPGFWLLELGLPEVERAPGHWLHRARLRLRAREPGLHAWPPFELEVESPGGEIERVEVPAHTLEVVSVLDAIPTPTPPHGLIAPAEPDTGGRGSAFAAGVATTLAAVGLIWLARRRRRSRVTATGTSAAPPPAPPWIAAQRELEAALALLPGEPVPAAEAGAGALRRYAARRFGLPAEAWTDPEFAAARPPPAGAAGWPRLVAAIALLDAARFAPLGESQGVAERVGEALEEARSLVLETRSREPHALVEQRAARS